MEWNGMEWNGMEINWNDESEMNGWMAEWLNVNHSTISSFFPLNFHTIQNFESFHFCQKMNGKQKQIYNIQQGVFFW
jgi:hypothetical protein